MLQTHSTRRGWATLALGLLVVLLIAGFIILTPRAPIALIRVVDTAGHPIPGATVRPEGLRTKPGPYNSSWYGWRTQKDVPNPSVRTDADGWAPVPYPKYVLERLETGTVCLSVSHPDYVAERPERVVTTTPVAGSSWRVWLDYLWTRLRLKTLVVRPDPIVLQTGAVLRISVPPPAATPRDARCFAQVSGMALGMTDNCSWPEPGVLLIRRVAAGPHTVRVVQLATNGLAWFSDVLAVNATTSQTNELSVSLKSGAVVQGRLDDRVPLPVRHGRIVAHVWPVGLKPEQDPPQWHGWTEIRDDGAFAFSPLPEGNLELVALCDGFISTNGPGQFGFHYPQRHLLGTNDLDVVVGMEPTARLEVRVTDDKGAPLNNVQVHTWPNVRYGEWAAVILMADCYNSADGFLKGPDHISRRWVTPAGFEGLSDATGLAVLSNLPVEVKQVSAEHPDFELPAVTTIIGQKRREADILLVGGQTNSLFLQLVRRGNSPLAQ